MQQRFCSLTKLLSIIYLTAFSTAIFCQPANKGLYKVLTLTGQKQSARDLPQDHGITGIWQKLLKLKTTASALHTQAHPDDEHADLLTYLGRAKGARTALLSLNRGESGGNVLSGESFDQLGLLRTQEFLLAASYYGLDDLYFTKLVDYGFSKRVEEAYDKWGKQNVLAEMVRVIRINRPLVIISRFHGTARDGHGNHQAAGEISQQAFTLAADPMAFPEQITNEGLRPWKALKFYRGGVRADEHWNMQLNTGEFSPWLGGSYKNFASLGYSFHRSQFGGQLREVNGPFIQYYERFKTQVKSDEKENSFFDGIDTSITGIFKITGETPTERAEALLSEISTEVNNAIAAVQPQNTTAILPFLTSGLAKTRQAIQLSANQPEALFMLQIKERQFVDAILAVSGIQLQAMAVPASTKEVRSFYEPLPVMGFAVPGQPFKVETLLLNPGSVAIEPKSLQLTAPSNWKTESKQQMLKPLNTNEKNNQSFTVTVEDNTSFSQPYFGRKSLNENQYNLPDKQFENLPETAAALQVAASFLINGQLIEIQMPVQVRQANQPYGYNTYTLKIAPAIGVNIKPALGIIPKNSKVKMVSMQVELVNNFDTVINGTLTLKLPSGWRAVPAQTPFSFSKAGEKNNFSIKVSLPAIDEKTYTIQATAIANGKEYTQGYEVISHRDNDQVVQYRAAVASIKGIDVTVAPGLSVGYIMGVGDEVPVGLQQLGAKVQLLTASDLAAANLAQFSAVIVGTRAYAVRQDLGTYNRRLLDYAKNGGHLIILFQTPEFVPDRMAPFSAVLPGNSEEISEENSPVTLLNPNHRVLNYPNKITTKDFDDWVEQRGSKFFSKWDTSYVPIISTNDVGQAPQSGGWLMAKYGKGNYTYCAYAFHRQMPNGVKGAFRIMANLLSYGMK